MTLWAMAPPSLHDVQLYREPAAPVPIVWETFTVWLDPRVQLYVTGLTFVTPSIVRSGMYWIRAPVSSLIFLFADQVRPPFVEALVKMSEFPLRMSAHVM